jgi:hypothetical protein
VESRRQLDPAGSAGTSPRIVFSLVILLFLASWSTAAAPPQTDPGTERDREYGVALAQLGQWDEARAVLLAGWRLHPLDERFPIELGGVAFKQKRYAEAARWLRHAIRLNPGDTYAADFLATIYFLQGNLEGALKYWNRIDKPKMANVQVEPALRVDPALLDRAFAFAPSSTLFLSDFLTSQARVRGLGIFPAFNFRLEARDEGTFDAMFAARERNGWGESKQEALLSMLRGVVYQTIYPEYSNIAQSAINVTSLLRWDTQKRRLAASLSGPLGQDPAYRYRVGLDLRNENWDLRNATFKLYKSAVSGEVSSFRGSGGWSWSTGGELSHRDYQNVFAPRLPPGVSVKGYQLKHLARLDRDLWRLPERRFESSASISSEAGRIWSEPAHAFERLQASVAARWMPQMAGDDYAIQQQFRTGRMFGQAPFDELFMLGLERDNDLWMRAHIGTRGGRKGSAPMVRNYFLSNSEIDKNLFSGSFLNVKLSPFVDVGKGSGKWLWDTGLQAKFRVLGVGFALIYGKDLRSGNNTFYVMAGRRN